MTTASHASDPLVGRPDVAGRFRLSLGLTLEMAPGRFQVRSRPGGGTTVEVWVPAKETLRG